MSKIKIGFIGQGYVGKNYADDFEARGYAVTRYAKEKPYNKNKEAIKDCDVVFIAVPTPTTPDGFDDSIIREALSLVGKGKIAVIKSTIVPGTTKSMQNKNPNIFVLHSPEFLTESTALFDAKNPSLNIIGIPIQNKILQEKARVVLSILPKSFYAKICLAEEAEIIKYVHNNLGYVKLIFINMAYDLAVKLGADWKVIKEALVSDPMVATKLNYHLDPIHKNGRGAGGHCLIKDFETFARLYKKTFPNDVSGISVLNGNVQKNIELLCSSGKDIEILKSVYNINQDK
ncbi:MAG: NAD(P)-binding domain-containing protein [bacterium]|nr:NAD(P)-binding domain-containing protein [bacterium]